MAKKKSKKAAAEAAAEQHDPNKPIQQGTTEHDRRHVPGLVYALGADGTWLKRCIEGKQSKRLKALDAQAVRITFTLTEKINEEEKEIINAENIVVDLRQCFEEEDQPAIAYIRRPWSRDVLKALRLICMTMTIDEKCRVDIPVTTQDLQLTNPWIFIIELHDHFQACWPWPMPERPPPIRLPSPEQDALIYEPPEEQERVLKELSEAQVKAERPWWDLRDTIVAFVGQTTAVSSWKPARFSRVTVNYRLRCADTGEIIWDTYEKGEPHSFTIGCGDVVPALDIAIRQNYALGQMGFILAKPAAGFGPYDHSLEAAKIFHKKFLDGFAFMEGYKSVFDYEVNGQTDREAITTVESPNDYDPAGEVKRAEAQKRRAQGLPPDLSNLPRVEQVENCVPNFMLPPSSLDMTQWLEQYANRHLIFENLKLLRINRLPNETSFHTDEDRVRFAKRWKEVAVRFWRIKDYVRAYQCFYQAIFILEPLSSRVLKVGPNEDDDCKTLRNKCVINSAVCLGKLEDWGELERVLTPVLQKNPDNEKAIYWMACVDYAKGNETTAMDSLKRLINMNSHNIDARKMLAHIKEAVQKREGAFTKEFVQPTSLLQPGRDARETPAPDWSELERDGYDIEMLKSWGIRPAKFVDEEHTLGASYDAGAETYEIDDYEDHEDSTAPSEV